MIILNAFLVGGIICLIAQYIMDKFKLLPLHVTCLFIIIGGLLDFADIYDKIVAFGDCGALIPISSFGHSIVDTALENARTDGFLGLLSGTLTSCASGVVMAILMAFIIAVIFKPKG